MILASILHDPNCELLSGTNEVITWIKKLYDEVLVSVSPATCGKMKAVLGNSIYLSPQDGIANCRRHVLSIANGNYIHYCDFDRIIHWATYYPEELRRTVKHKADFIVFGRTDKAFFSHPELQRVTEGRANEQFARWHGSSIDILSGSRIVSSEAAKPILASSTATGAGVDAEWCKIIVEAELKLNYIEVNGLEYEAKDPGVSTSELDKRYGHLQDIQNALQT